MYQELNLPALENTRTSPIGDDIKGLMSCQLIGLRLHCRLKICHNGMVGGIVAVIIPNND
jgi:hypothetical protein